MAHKTVRALQLGRETLPHCATCAFYSLQRHTRRPLAVERAPPVHAAHFAAVRRTSRTTWTRLPNATSGVTHRLDFCFFFLGSGLLAKESHRSIDNPVFFLLLLSHSSNLTLSTHSVCPNAGPTPSIILTIKRILSGVPAGNKKKRRSSKYSRRVKDLSC